MLQEMTVLYEGRSSKASANNPKASSPDSTKPTRRVSAVDLTAAEYEKWLIRLQPSASGNVPQRPKLSNTSDGALISTAVTYPGLA